jgi:hypothetical protein
VSARATAHVSPAERAGAHDDREAEGKLDQAKGSAKDAADDLKDAAGKLVDRARDEADARRAEQAGAEDRR